MEPFHIALDGSSFKYCMESMMNRILVIGETPHMGTMYSTIIKELCFRLNQNGVTIACMGFNYTGWPFDNDIINYTLYPWIGPPNNPQNINHVLKDFKPDTLLLLGPPFLFSWLGKKKNSKYRIILSTSFKSLPLNTFMKEIYAIADTIVVHSRFEETSLNEIFEDMDIVYVPPGINTEDLKATGTIPRDNRFKIGCVVKDTPLIDIPSLLKAFGIVAKSKENIIFGVFSDISQLNQWKINDMLDVYDIKDRCIIMKPQPEINFGFPSMGDVYASIDLLVLPHQDLTINIPLLEAAYCNIPVIIPHGGPNEEYAPGTAIFLGKSDTFFAPPLNTIYNVFDAEEIADKIIFMYLDKKHKKQLNKKTMEQYDWNIVSKEWMKLLGSEVSN